MVLSYDEFCQEICEVLRSLISYYYRRGDDLFREEYHYRRTLKFCRRKVAFLIEVINKNRTIPAGVSEDEAFAQLDKALSEFPWHTAHQKDEEVEASALNIMDKTCATLKDAVEKRAVPTLAEIRGGGDCYPLY